jgi:hypothetical protein
MFFVLLMVLFFTIRRCTSNYFEWIGGRIIPEQVAGCFQNHWQDVSGLGGRIRPEYSII